MALYVFNPENDLALASGIANYTAPERIRHLREDLAVVPAWLAGDPAWLLVPPTEANVSFLKMIESCYRCVPHVEIYSDGMDFGSEVYPWGWSLSLCEELKRRGVFVGNWNASELEDVRGLSHRKTSVDVLRWFRANTAEMELPSDLPVMCDSVEKAEAAVERFGDAVMKMPWSSSGRGVCRVRNRDFGLYRSWVSGVVRRQGAVAVERYLDVVQNFALEFFIANGTVRFCGYSIFFTTPQYSYEHAMVASSSKLFGRLSSFLGESVVERLKEATMACLTELVAPKYKNGHVGVDMMVYRKQDGGLSVNPCVEVNLRTTMGMVAAALGERILAEGKVGEMRVAYHKERKGRDAYISLLRPPVISEGFLVEGAQLLAPVTESTCYTAVLSVTG